MKKGFLFIGPIVIWMMLASAGWCAYHHEGEQDAAKFLSVYPDKAGTKLDHCALCHIAGQYESNGKMVRVGIAVVPLHVWLCRQRQHLGHHEFLWESLPRQWEKHTAITAIELWTPMETGTSTSKKLPPTGSRAMFPTIRAGRRALSHLYQGSVGSPGEEHTQFLLMNTSRSGDYYAEYTGLPFRICSMMPASRVKHRESPFSRRTVGLSTTLLEEDLAQPEFYHVNGLYPSSSVPLPRSGGRRQKSDTTVGVITSPSCVGRSNGDAIVVEGGLKIILAYKRDGQFIDSGIARIRTTSSDGEDPFRVVPPQKNPSPPDQSSKADNQSVIWPSEKQIGITTPAPPLGQ